MAYHIKTCPRHATNGFMSMQNDLYTRPQSVIKIVEIPDSTTANPKPTTDCDSSFGNFVSAQKIKDITGVLDLLTLTELKIKVDTTETSVGNIGSMVPNLKALNLSNSYISSVRDLGTNLYNLNTLCLSRCCLTELDGISCLENLKELFLAYNDISDLSPLSMLENLKVLDLEGNNINDITQIEFLSLCSCLSVLTLRGNPLEHAPTPSANEKDLKYFSYRDAVLSCLPQLKALDDEAFLVEIINGERVKRINPCHLEHNLYKSDLQLIQESLKNLESEGLDDVKEGKEGFETNTLRPISARKRIQSAKPTLSTDSVNRTATVKDHLSEEASTENFLFDKDHCSALTHGNVMCGNPVQALRQRNRKKVNNIVNRKDTTDKHDKCLQQTNTVFLPERSYLNEVEKMSSKEDVFEELRLWRLKNSRLFGTTDEYSGCKLFANMSKESLNQQQLTPSVSPTPPLIQSTISVSPTPPPYPKNSQISPHILRKPFLSSTSRPVGLLSTRPQTAYDFRSQRYRFNGMDEQNNYQLLDAETNSGLQDNLSASSICKRPSTRAGLEFSKN